MNILNISVIDKVATYQKRNGAIVCGNSDYQIKFTFDEEWSTYPTKTARFIYDSQFTDVVFTGDTCEVPIMQDITLLSVGVFAGNLITTTPALIPCVKSILCENGTPVEPTPDVYAQIMELLNSSGGGGGGTGGGADGEDGATFTPSVSSVGVISWTNDKGLKNPDPVNIRGPQGNDGASIYVEQMEESDEGVFVELGNPNLMNHNSFFIKHGKDGTSVTVESVSESTTSGGSNVVTFSDGKTLTVKNGKNGTSGTDGSSVYIDEMYDLADGSGVYVSLYDESSAQHQSFTINHGADGKTPVKGTDYFTDADKEEMVADVVASMEGIPDYWQTHLDERVEDIRRAMETAGRNKSSFFFYSDAHWDNDSTYTAKLAPNLLKYLYKKTPINKTNYGGDIVNGTGSTDTDNMKYLWDWREQLRGLPNHHSVIGNHDDGNGEMDRQLSKEYVYSYLLAPEENNDIVWGGDFYYYIDDKSESTRYLYLDIFYDGVSSTQVNFVKEALKSTPKDWHVIAIAHAWFGVDYGTTENPIYPPVLKGFATEMQPVLDMFDNYNARGGEYGDCGGWVELCIGGHYHLDHYDHTEGGIPVIIVEADTLHNRSGVMPQKLTTDESSISAVVVDYNEKVVKVIRVGRGESYDVPINVSKVSYTNVIPLSIDKDGTPFADGKGWMANSRVGSGGIYAGNQTPGTDQAQWVTGYIPIDGFGTRKFEIYLENITFDSTSTNGNHGVYFFGEDFAKISPKTSGTPTHFTVEGLKNYVARDGIDESGNFFKITFSPDNSADNTNVKYFCICCGGIDDTSIITIDEPID